MSRDKRFEDVLDWYSTDEKGNSGRHHDGYYLTYSFRLARLVPGTAIQERWRR